MAVKSDKLSDMRRYEARQAYRDPEDADFHEYRGQVIVRCAGRGVPFHVGRLNPLPPYIVLSGQKTKQINVNNILAEVSASAMSWKPLHANMQYDDDSTGIEYDFFEETDLGRFHEWLLRKSRSPKDLVKDTVQGVWGLLF